MNTETVGRCGARMPSLFANGPSYVCALAAGHAGWHRDDQGAEWSTPDAELVTVPDTQLTAEQEIRARALDAAVRALTDVDAPTVRDLEQIIIGTASRFAEYIQDGTEPGPAGFYDAAADHG